MDAANVQLLVLHRIFCAVFSPSVVICERNVRHRLFEWELSVGKVMRKFRT